MSDEETTQDETKPEPAEENEVKEYQQLGIGKVPTSSYKVFTELAKHKKITQGKLFTLILNSYQSLGLDFDETENSILQEARAIAPNTFETRLKKMILRYADSIVNSKDKPEGDVDISKKNSRRAADVRAEKLIEQIFNHNNNAPAWYDKIFLTKSSVMDYANDRKQNNSDAISMGKLVLNRCLERNRARIDQHHAEHKLMPTHNSEAYYERLKMNKGVTA